MPWRNGKGLTFEIASHPCDGSQTDFDWRISLAHIQADGAFSSFPGVDRTIAIIKGGLTLHHGQAMTRLDPETTPFAFSGDLAVEAEDVLASTAALNVMTRCAVCSHLVHRGPSGVEIMIVSGEEVVQAVLDGALSMTIWHHRLPAFSPRGI